MRHLRRVKKLNRTKSHREALLKNLAISLFDHESIKTTNTKAMVLKGVADRLITLAKKERPPFSQAGLCLSEKQTGC